MKATQMAFHKLQLLFINYQAYLTDDQSINSQKPPQHRIIAMIDQENYRKKNNIFLASAIGSIVSTIITNPIEVAKLQIQYYPVACSQPHFSNYRTLSTCGCAKFIWTGSLKSLKVAVPQVLFSNILYYELYQNTRRFIQKSMGLDGTSCTVIASLASRFIVTTANVPLESTRIKISNNIRRSGIMPTFHGYKVTLARDLIYSSLFWSLLEGYRNTVVGGQYRENASKNADFTLKNFTLNLLPAFFIGGFVSAITTPLDTLKTRIQSKSIDNYKIPSSIADIYNKEGLNKLFSGIKLRVMKNSLHTSLYLFMYEWYLNKVSIRDAIRATMEEQA